MSELQTTPRLSLFQIESELLGLVDARADVLEMRDALLRDGVTPPPEMEAELSTIDGLIRDYLKQEIRKVDGIAYAVKEFEARGAAKAVEAKRLHESSARDLDTAVRIKAMVLEVMQEFNEKKLPGRLFTISRQGNGGVQALTIAQPDLVPMSLKRFTISLRADVARDFAAQFEGQYRIIEEMHPDPKDIRVALERGEGVPGCRLEERGEHIRIK